MCRLCYVYIRYSNTQTKQKLDRIFNISLNLNEILVIIKCEL